jgi:N-acyl-D-aspartate/D-glutamate deacylase
MEDFRRKIKEIYNSGKINIGGTHSKADAYWPIRFKILKCRNEGYEGKTIEEIASEREKNALDTLFDIIVEDPDTLWLQIDDERAKTAAKLTFLKHPLATLCTDMHMFPAVTPNIEPKHPRPYAAPMAYCAYPYYLGNWVKQKRVMSLEDAVKKATHNPAKMLGLDDRGILRLGACADIVVFDYESMDPVVDYLNPTQPPEGIEYVLVNGKVVYEGKKHTGERPGKVLRHRARG